MAVPALVAAVTVTAWALAADSVMVKFIAVVPALPSTCARSAIDTVGTAASSLVIVPVPSPSLIVALTGAVRLTTNVSVGSLVVSPLTCTVMVCGVVELAGKVTVPLPAV